MEDQSGNRIAIVSGASRGIGAAVAHAAAAAGYGVVVNYSADAEGAHAVVRRVVAQGGRALAVQADVSQPADVVRLFDEAGDWGNGDSGN